MRIACGGLDRLGAFTRLTTGARRAALVSDANVAALYAPRALGALHRSGVRASLVTLPPGERTKSAARLLRLWELLSRLDLDRSAAVVALGGGVVGDLAGFAAATWLRGIPWVCVPTSLLAQVDSSVGGKTGVNLKGGKNLLGVFHQPAGVLADPETLATLPPRQLRAGLAEVVKTGMAVDARLFAWTERHTARLLAADPVTLREAVVRSIRAKARVVRADEREREGGRRSSLNYGHTLGHALALPRRMPPMTPAALLCAMSRDKKRHAGRIRWVLTPRLGHASVPRLVSSRLVEAALLEAGARA